LKIRRAYLEDGRYRLVACQIELDGVVVFDSAEPERLRTRVEAVYESSVTPGHHELSTHQTVRGKGRGDLAYLGGYMFRIRSSHSIDVGPIGETCASVTLYFKQNYSLPLSQRPSMSFDVEPHTASASPEH
jgi:hypothetical protein